MAKATKTEVAEHKANQVENPELDHTQPERAPEVSEKKMSKADAEAIVAHYANVVVSGEPADLKAARKLLAE